MGVVEVVALAAALLIPPIQYKVDQEELAVEEEVEAPTNLARHLQQVATLLAEGEVVAEGLPIPSCRPLMPPVDLIPEVLAEALEELGRVPADWALVEVAVVEGAVLAALSL